MKRTKVKGKDVMMFIGGKAIALATSCDLTLNGETEKTVTKDDGLFADKTITGLDFSGSSDSVIGAAEDSAVDITYGELMDLMLQAKPVDMVFGEIGSTTPEVPDTGWVVPTANGYKGKVLITSVGKTGPQSGVATLKVSFEGSGPLTKVAVAE